MQRGTRRQPGAGYKYWAREARRLHGRHQVDDVEGDVYHAKKGASVEFGKKIKEAVQENLGWSGESQLAEKGELDTKIRSPSQSEADRSAQAEKCREENKAKTKAKDGWENWSRTWRSRRCSSVDDRF